MVCYIRNLNKSLLLRVPMFCLRFLTPQIHNFSNYTLNCSEHYLLSLGLNFRPTPHLMSVNVLKHQLDDFVRSVRIKHFFRDYNFANTSQYRKLFVKSEWIPPRGPPWIENPISAIRTEQISESWLLIRTLVLRLLPTIGTIRKFLVFSAMRSFTEKLKQCHLLP